MDNKLIACCSEAENLKLYNFIAARLLNRLKFIKINPQNILLLGAITPAIIKKLQGWYRQGNICALIKDHNIINHQLTTATLFSANIDALPLAANKIDLIIANLALSSNMLDQGKQFWQEIYRIIINHGTFLFSLIQLIDDQNTINNNFILNIGNLLSLNNFSNPVVDRELINVNYSSTTQCTEIVYGYALGKQSTNIPVTIRVPEVS